MKITVIVPVYNDEARIVKCIEALKNQSVPRSDYEIIVVDNGSTDKTLDILKEQSGILLLQCAKPGSYAARNTALKYSQGEYIAFTDSDCMPCSDWLSSLLHVAEKTAPGSIIGGPISFFVDEEKVTERAAILFEESFSMDQYENIASGKCITANFFCEKSLFSKTGPFNEDSKSGGDLELSQRVISCGGATVFAPDAVVFHPSRNAKELLEKRRRVVGGVWDLNFKKNKLNGFSTLSWRALKLLIKRSVVVCKNSELSLKEKLNLNMLLIRLFAASIFELCRLALGSQTQRV